MKGMGRLGGSEAVPTSWRSKSPPQIPPPPLRHRGGIGLGKTFLLTFDHIPVVAISYQ